MSNRISGFTVTFEHSVSEEYMDMVKGAIQLYKGVVSVEPSIEDTATYLGMSQEKHRIVTSLFDLIKSDFGERKK